MAHVNHSALFINDNDHEVLLDSLSLCVLFCLAVVVVVVVGCASPVPPTKAFVATGRRPKRTEFGRTVAGQATGHNTTHKMTTIGRETRGRRRNIILMLLLAYVSQPLECCPCVCELRVHSSLTVHASLCPSIHHSLSTSVFFSPLSFPLPVLFSCLLLVLPSSSPPHTVFVSLVRVGFVI